MELKDVCQKKILLFTSFVATSLLFCDKSTKPLFNLSQTLRFSFILTTWKASNVLAFPFDCMESVVRLRWTCPSIVQNCSFDYIEAFLRFYWKTEPSSLSRRAFAIATPSARYRNAEPSATSWIQRSALVNPHMRFWKSPKTLQSIHTSTAPKAFPCPLVSI